MNRANALILVDNPQVVGSGLWPDRHVTQVPLWEIAQNVEFAGGKVRRRVPNSLIPIGVAAGRTRGIGQLQASNGVRWIFFNQGSNVYRWYGPAAELVGALPNSFVLDASSVLDPTIPDFTQWGNWMVVNAPDQGAYIFKPGSPNTFAPLDGAPQDALAYFKKRNQLLAVGCGVNRRDVAFSDADAIEGAANWTAAADNTAGEIPLEELNTPVRAACHFGPSLAIFGENQMFQVNWVGAPFYYGQQKLLDGIGCVGKLACASDQRVVYGFGRNGAWKTDGLQATYVDEVVIRDYFQENINWDQRGKIAVRRNDITGCIEFSFPMRGAAEPNEAWAYDPRYGGWSMVPAFRIMDIKALLDKPIQSTADNQLELVEDNPGIDSPLLLETKAMLIQRDNQYLHIGALIDEVEIFAHVADKVEFQYGVSESPEGPFSWTDPQEVFTDNRTYKLKPPFSGVYHKLRFKNFGLEWSFDLQGFALFGAPDGYKRDKS